MRAARVDANQQEIVEGLRLAGCSIQSLASIGKGCPDLLVGRAGRNYLIEIKMNNGKLNPEQIDWHQAWTGQVNIAHTLHAALAIVGLKRKHNVLSAQLQEIEHLKLCLKLTNDLVTIKRERAERAEALAQSLKESVASKDLEIDRLMKLLA